VTSYINGDEIREGDVIVAGLGVIATVISLKPLVVVTGAGSNLGDRLIGTLVAGERFLLLHREDTP
jgi:hypothetical protein